MTTHNELDTDASNLDSILDFAVIGAGIAGLTAASKIQEQGYRIAVFEKARGTGGRMSSKRVSKENGAFMAFDLGCVSIAGQSEAFCQQLKSWHISGVIKPWFKDDHGRDHYVAVPRNSALTRYLSKDLECHFGTRIVDIQKIEGVWNLFINDGEHDKKLLVKANNIIIAIPPAQAYDLLPSSSSFKLQLEKVEVSPQWVLAVEVDNVSSYLPLIQHPESNVIFSISQENLKPERDVGRCDSSILQVQATPKWTLDHLNLSPEQISDLLINELERHLEQSLNIKHSYAHRWLYSCVAQGIQAREGYLWDEQGIGLIGDYINTEFEGVESAWLSGKQLAEWITLNNTVVHS